MLLLCLVQCPCLILTLSLSSLTQSKRDWTACYSMMWNMIVLSTASILLFVTDNNEVKVQIESHWPLNERIEDLLTRNCNDLPLNLTVLSAFGKLVINQCEVAYPVDAVLWSFDEVSTFQHITALRIPHTNLLIFCSNWKSVQSNYFYIQLKSLTAVSPLLCAAYRTALRFSPISKLWNHKVLKSFACPTLASVMWFDWLQYHNRATHSSSMRLAAAAVATSQTNRTMQSKHFCCGHLKRKWFFNGIILQFCHHPFAVATTICSVSFFLSSPHTLSFSLRLLFSHFHHAIGNVDDGEENVIKF